MSIFSTAPGFYTSAEMPIDLYHKDSALGSSSLKTLIKKTPAHLKYSSFPEKPHLVFGAAVHSLILEPQDSAKIIRGPEDRRGKKWTELKEQCDSEGKLLLTSSDYDDAMRVRDSVLSNQTCAELLCGDVVAEASVFAEDQEHGFRVKCRPDLVNKNANIMVDLKTTVSASPEYFAKSVSDFLYMVQQAFYERVWRLHNGAVFDGFIFIAVEKSPPFLTAVYELDSAAVLEGYNLMNRAIATYKECAASNVWHGYPDKVQTISIPKYAFQTFDPDTGEMVEEEAA